MHYRTLYEQTNYMENDINHNSSTLFDEWIDTTDRKNYIRMLFELRAASAQCGKFGSTEFYDHKTAFKRNVREWVANIIFVQDSDSKREAVLPKPQPFSEEEFYGSDLALRAVTESNVIEFVDDENVVAAMKQLKELLNDQKLRMHTALVSSASGLSLAAMSLGFIAKAGSVNAKVKKVSERVKVGQPDTMKLTKGANILPNDFKTNLDFLRALFARAKDPGELWSTIKPLAWELSEIEHRFVTNISENELLDIQPNQAEYEQAKARTREIREQIFCIAEQLA